MKKTLIFGIAIILLSSSILAFDGSMSLNISGAYQFDMDNTNQTDSTGNYDNATPFNAEFNSAVFLGYGSYTMDNDGEGITMNSISLKADVNFSLHVWFYWLDIDERFNSIWTMSNDFGVNDYVAVYDDRPGIDVWYIYLPTAGGNCDASGAVAPTANAWNSLTLVYDGTGGSLTSYLNGAQLGQDAAGCVGAISAPAGASKMMLGDAEYAGAENTMRGNIDEFYFWHNYTLTIYEIGNLSNRLFYPFLLSMEIIAHDVYSGDNINNFAVEFQNGSGFYNVTTSNGSVFWPENQIVNITIFNATGYFDASHINYNTSLANIDEPLYPTVNAFLLFRDEPTLSYMHRVEFEVFGTNYSFRDISANETYNLTGLPAGTYEIRYGINDSAMTSRSYFFSIPHTDITNVNITLLTLYSNQSYTFTRIMNTQDALPYDGYVQIQRAYVGQNNQTYDYKIVEVAQIDSQGNAIFSAIPNIVAYRLRMLDVDFNIVDTKTPSYLIDASAEIIVQIDEDYLGPYYSSTGISATLTYQNSTNHYIFDYNDPSSSIDVCCLEYYFTSFNVSNSSQVCSVTASDTLTLLVNGTWDGTYSIVAYCNIEEETFVFGTASLKGQSLFIFNLTTVGLIFWLLTILVSATITGFANPTVSILLAVSVTLSFGLGFLGLIYLSTYLTMGLFVVGLIILFLIYKSKK